MEGLECLQRCLHRSVAWAGECMKDPCGQEPGRDEQGGRRAPEEAVHRSRSSELDGGDEQSRTKWREI